MFSEPCSGYLLGLVKDKFSGYLSPLAPSLWIGNRDLDLARAFRIGHLAFPHFERAVGHLHVVTNTYEGIRDRDAKQGRREHFVYLPHCPRQKFVGREGIVAAVFALALTRVSFALAFIGSMVGC